MDEQRRRDDVIERELNRAFRTLRPHRLANPTSTPKRPPRGWIAVSTRARRSRSRRISPRAPSVRPWSPRWPASARRPTSAAAGAGGRGGAARGSCPPPRLQRSRSSCGCCRRSVRAGASSPRACKRAPRTRARSAPPEDRAHADAPLVPGSAAPPRQRRAAAGRASSGAAKRQHQRPRRQSGNRRAAAQPAAPAAADRAPTKPSAEQPPPRNAGPRCPGRSKATVAGATPAPPPPAPRRRQPAGVAASAAPARPARDGPRRGNLRAADLIVVAADGTGRWRRAGRVHRVRGGRHCTVRRGDAAARRRRAHRWIVACRHCVLAGRPRAAPS